MKQQINQEIVSKGLSDRAMENLQRNKMVRRQDSIFLTIEPDEELKLKFDAELIEVKDPVFEGVKKRRFQYTVINEENTTKYWTISQRTSKIIDSYLEKGQKVLKVKRIGDGVKTRYVITST